MSHLKRVAESVSLRFTKNVTHIALAFTCFVMNVCGCAVVQIPSYRLEECAAESYAAPPIVLPAMPSVPMPGWLAHWKAEKDLPKPPAAPRFHPLPTRPMFQAGPTPEFGMGAPGEAGCYGTLPPAQSWNAVESIPAKQVPTLASPL